MTIAQRVQIGMGFGGGIGWARGDVTQLSANGTETIEAKGQFSPFGGELDFVPLGKVDVGVAGILAPGMKIRASAGFNYPGTTVFKITGVFLFGAR